MLNFGVRMGSGAFMSLWPFMSNVLELAYMYRVPTDLLACLI